MLTQADDYPIHQLPEPVATAGTDRNFYDRYYFQGYSPDQSIVIGGALGVYPHLDLMDAHFMVQHAGVQHRVFASKHLRSERLDLQVGPLRLEILQPLQRLRLQVDDAAHGVQADLTFEALAAPIEEPRFTQRAGPRTVLDLTRMTQSGRWQGQLQLDGHSHTVAGWRGTRDRSWGIRPLGARDAQPMPDMGAMQWYWLWCPMHFDDYLLFFHTNDDAHGNGWNRSAVLVALREPQQPQQHLYDVRFTPRYQPGTRQLSHCDIEGRLPGGTLVRVQLRCGTLVPKQGEGYNHPTWGHGMYHGPLVSHFERVDVSAPDLNAFSEVHRHAMCEATLSIGAEPPRHGQATLEQMLLGPHAPSGFTDLADVAPLPASTHPTATAA